MLLLDIMIEYFEDNTDENFNIELFKKVGENLGFKKSEALYKLLDIPLDEYNEKYEEIEKWKKEIAENLKILQVKKARKMCVF